MKGTDGFYVNESNQENLKQACKKRGDKSKIVNEALSEYFKKMRNTQKPKVVITI